MRSVLTIATGKKVYIDMAINLARSFLRWHQESDIIFCLATDRPELVPVEVYASIWVIDTKHLQHMEGFSIKLYIDQLALTPNTLFIDADCLIYGSLEPVFEKFKGQAVSAIGDIQTEGEFFCNVSCIIHKLSLPYLPRFVGGIYYLEKNATSQLIFEQARSLISQYDDLRLVRLRGKENEEPLLAIAMAMYGQQPIPEDGSIKADRMFFNYCTSNVIVGKAILFNREAFPTNAYYKIKEATPVVVHYNNDFTENFEYLSDVCRLYFYSRKACPRMLIEPLVAICYTIPGKTTMFFKKHLRVYYRKVFGVRKIKQIKRLESVAS
jgi:hypothetical protein